MLTLTRIPPYEIECVDAVKPQQTTKSWLSIGLHVI